MKCPDLLNPKKLKPATATAGPIMVMVMGVAGGTERGRNTNLNSRVQPKPVATSARSLSATGSASPLADRNPACVPLREPISLCGNVLKETHS
jgi:hypothetical protein